MYSVMIVEDERLVRLGFKNAVAWERYIMAVVADAANGREAWTHYSGGRRPDVVMRDTRGGMPPERVDALNRMLRDAEASDRPSKGIGLSKLTSGSGCISASGTASRSAARSTRRRG
ncbi:hypothetical protein SAMN02799624_00558 [Paenibacillus sp. UNC496MF]|uniref:hypothetical protein n=1 Tax=Paenibacillus sp. UNC496MF TaxID=1502753 RepID=UPI0008EB1B38|nr:hypothetical protein [Paenibacillus sp. UNC496MF]SFI35620.1 hypothetical protein SAMN02799624_00558 [Paenibacillus sp. UNC496MF]